MLLKFLSSKSCVGSFEFIFHIFLKCRAFRLRNSLALAGITLATTLPQTTALGAVYFADNFEQGLVQWQPGSGGVVAADPVFGQVLTFDRVWNSGDIFSTLTVPAGAFLSFDYKGFGGYIGVNGDWLAGQAGYNIEQALTYDNTWRHYEVQVRYSGKIMVEDFDGTTGQQSPAYFDNILVADHAGATFPNSLVVWTNPAPVVYGTPLSGLQLNASNSVPGTFTYNPSVGVVLNAGTNNLTTVFIPADLTHYAASTNTVTLVVKPAPLVITANSTHRAYGQANPVFTGTVTGLTNGDSMTETFSCTASNASSGGTYTITPGLSDPGNQLANYTVTTNTGTLTVVWPASALAWQALGETVDGYYYIDPDGFGGLDPVFVRCEFALSGGGWTAISAPCAATVLNSNASQPREYLYALDGSSAWYRSPTNNLPWSYSYGSDLYGTYFYGNGNSTSGSFSVTPSGEHQYYGVGGSSGGGGTHKVLIAYSSCEDPSIAQVQICQDQPGIFGGACACPVTAYIREKSTPYVSVPPFFTQAPTNQTVALGANVQLVSSALGSGSLVYQWYFDGVALPGQTAATLSLNNVQKASAGNYWVTVRSSLGSATTAAVALNVETAITNYSYSGGLQYYVVPAGVTQLAVSLTGAAGAYGGNDGQGGGAASPQLMATATLAVVPGSTLTLSVGAAGAPGTGCGNNPGGSGGVSPLPGYGGGNGGAAGPYGCSGSGGGGGAATVLVIPNGGTIIAGGGGGAGGGGNYSSGAAGLTSITVAATNSVTVGGTGVSHPADGGGGGGGGGGAVGGSGGGVAGCDCGAAAGQGGGSWLPSVYLAPGSAWSTTTGSYGGNGAITLAPVSVATRLAIQTAPTNATVSYGGATSFSVVPASTTPVHYQWQFNGVNLTDNAQVFGSQSNVLSLAGVTMAAAGAYTVLLTNNYGGTSVAATLTVVPTGPVIAWNNPVAITYGNPLTGTQLNASAGQPGAYVYSPPAGTILKAGANVLTVTFVPNDQTDYTNVSSSVTLQVAPAPLIVTANDAVRVYGQNNPVFTGTLTGVVNGDNITPSYASSAVSFSPPGTYTIVPGLNDPGNQLPNYLVTSHNGTLTVNAGPPPGLTALTPNSGLTNGGTSVTLFGTNFELGATVSFGGVASPASEVNSGTQITATTPMGSLGPVDIVLSNPDHSVATLLAGFSYTGSLPLITNQPASQSISLGGSAVFSVGAEYGDGYQWQFNGLNLHDNGRISGSQGPVLTIPNLQAADTANYQVVVTNHWGLTRSVAVPLTVIVPPVITTPPQNQAVGIGGTANFNVAFTGTPPFSYQWLVGGSPLSGATNATLTVNNVQTGNQGQQYSVTVGSPGGSVTSSPGTLSILNYCASVQPGQAVYPMGTAVPLSVQTFACGSSSPVPNAAATVYITTAGTTRSLAVTTGPTGTAVVNFVPLATETGNYQVAAALPGQPVPGVQATFSLVGMSLNPASVSAVLIPGLPVTNTISLNNLSGVALTGISTSFVGQPDNVQVTVNAPGSLAGNATSPLTLVLTASGSTASQAQFYLEVTTAQGNLFYLPIAVTVKPPAPLLVATPGSLSGSMTAGGQTIVNFYVANVGGAASGPVTVVLPALAWMHTVTKLPIPPIAPGQSNQITLQLTPPLNQVPGPYPGTVELASTNANLSVPFNFACVSDQMGLLAVTVQDELTTFGAGSPNVSNATITVTDFLSGNQVTNAVTDDSGAVLFTNLTSAYYTVAVAATNHGSFSTTLLVAAAQTNELTAFLPLQLVDYTWNVVPTIIPDHYTFTLQTTFATEVPWPVVTVSPGAVDLCSVAGVSTQIDLTITNSGLIAAQGLNLYFGTNLDWVVTPLVTSLGDLAPRSGITVPVTFTRIGTSTQASNSITAQVLYGVATPNTTNYALVPVFVFDANPASCAPENPTPPPVVTVCPTCGSGGGGFAGIGSGASGGAGSGGGLNIYNNGGNGSGGSPQNPITPPLPTYPLQTPSSVQVQVKLQIDQSAIISRSAFKATLGLTDNAGAAISNLSASITVYDASNNVANSLFGIPAPVLTGVNAVDGTGTLSVGAAGSVGWTIIPATNAAPTAPTAYTVGGSFSYVLNGEPVTVPLYPVPITVLPTPIINVDYFLQHDVFADDPFTPQIEPSVPFPLGMLVKNIGYGDAYDFTITSAQPQIVENQNDLFIAFKLIGSEEGTNQSISPSFTLDFGLLGPQSTADGLWYMTSTLEGQFISFAANYHHVDDFGNTNTSVIDSVRIHEMNHVVRITQPADDGLPDFLVNDTTNVDALPEVVYSSDGTTNLVTSVTNGLAVGVPSGTSSTITVTVPPTSGWGYFEIIDPGNDSYPIVSVTRSDGVQLLVGPNVWQTPERLHMIPPKYHNLIHIFDYNSPGTYTITYGPQNGLANAYTPLALVSSENPAGFKDAVRFSAALPSDASGSIVFLTNGVSWATNALFQGIATSPVITDLPPGTNVIAVLYPGDTNYLAATNTLTEVVTNHFPLAASMVVPRTPGLTVKVSLADLATNWSDADGYPVKLVSISSTTTNGQKVYFLNLTSQPDGSYTITNTAYLGYVNKAKVNDQISYAISDGQGDTNTGLINLVVSLSPLFGQITGLVNPGGHATTLNFLGYPSYNYSVQRSTNLTTWVNIWTTNAPPAGPFKYTDTYPDLGGVPPSAAYYRLSWNP